MDAIERYVQEFSAPQGEVLDWLQRETNLRTNHARMLCGRTVGAILHNLVKIQKPRRVLELGVFTGYSSICLASALEEGSVLDAIEINDELEDLIREGYSRAGVSDRINLIFGDAVQVLETLGEREYDLVYIDANKREYIAYYQAVIDLIPSGGVIIADNVLWDGKGCEATPPRDAQTQGILAFNAMVAADERVTNFILPMRDGLNIIRKL